MATLDKSLDEIITARPKAGGRRGSRRGAGAGAGAAPAPQASAARARYSGSLPAANGNRAAAPAPVAVPQGDATKIIVSNLPLDVNEAQIKELFQSTVGALREVILSYDAKGHSKGMASVTFQKRGDANKAYTQYNNRLIDGKRPMKIEIVVDPSRPAPPPTLSQRVAPAKAAAPAANNGNGAANSSARGQGGRSAGGKPAQGARNGGGRGGGRKKNPERPTKSAADLDAEMEDYTKPAPAPTA